MELGSQQVVIYSGTVSGPGTFTCGMRKFSEKMSDIETHAGV